MQPSSRIRVGRIVVVALVLGWASIAIASPPEPTSLAMASHSEPAFDLTGSWRLDRTQDLDEYLEKSGASWWRRQLAKLGSSRLRQTIDQDGHRFEIESVSPVETRKDVFVADGKTPRSVEDAGGETMTWIARIEGPSLVLDGEGDLGRRTVRREIVDDSMVMTVFNPDANAECKLFFERAESE